MLGVRKHVGRIVAICVACMTLGAVSLACSAAPAEDDLIVLPERSRDDGSDKEDTSSNGTDKDAALPGTPIPACTDECAVNGERRCKADAPKSFESCLPIANGCLAWMESTCVSGGTCDPNAKQQCVGSCPPAGKESCTQLDTRRCTGKKLETCSLEAGCPVWKETQDCGATNKICDGNACVTQCTSNCTAANTRRCVSGTNTYETCKEVQPGCFKWQTATSCGSSKVCQGAGSCVCNDQCTTALSNQCVSPNTFKTCTTNSAGCKVWTAEKSCVRSVPSPGCFAYGKACFGQCSDQCTTDGQLICTGSSTYQRCGRNSEQCLALTTGSCKTSQVCFASVSVCANGS